MATVSSAGTVNVLLVEDNASDQELTIRALKKHGVGSHITVVGDGAAALDFLFRRGIYCDVDAAGRPALVLLDLKLPKVSGIEVLRAIKEDEVMRTIPVVVLTSSCENSDLIDCYRLGANSYVVKPVEFTAFSHAVGQVGTYWTQINRGPIK